MHTWACSVVKPLRITCTPGAGEVSAYSCAEFKEYFFPQILVVTDTYHVFRTQILFSRYYDDVSVWGVEVAPRTRAFLALREVLALVKGILLLNQTPYELYRSIVNIL